jgi:hypothetical protein
MYQQQAAALICINQARDVADAELTPYVAGNANSFNDALKSDTLLCNTKLECAA